MSKLLNLPGTTKDGYHALSEPVKSHTVSAGGIPQPIELGDLANDEFYDRVHRVRESIRHFDAKLTELESRQLASLQPSLDTSTVEKLSLELDELRAALSLAATELKSHIAALGSDVAHDPARRGHWDNLKGSLKRAIERQQTIEMAQRERVRERVARQYRIVKPEASDAEVKAILSSSSGLDPAGSSSGAKVFQQALAGSSQRATLARSALDAARSDHAAFVHLERSLVELASLIQQVAELVAEQDPAIVRIEQATDDARGDVELGLKNVQQAKVSAMAARHKRKICAAIAIIMVVIVIVVVVVQMRGAGRGEGGAKDEAAKVEPAEKPIEL